MKSQFNEDLIKKIQESACFSKETDTKTLNEKNATDISNFFKLSLGDVYIEALTLGITPLRYLKNQASVSVKEQIILAESKLAVAGTGGLGGHVIHLLARIGIGTIYIFDHDIFDESNQNRQLFSSTENKGKFKVHVTKQIINLINPAVKIIAYPEKISSEVSELKNVDIFVDALDNANDRLALGKLANELGIPLVHGSIAGFEGRILTQYPGGIGLKTLFGGENNNRPAEEFLGTPSITPSIIGSIQAMEVIKILLKKGDIFKNKMLYLNLESLTSNQFDF